MEAWQWGYIATGRHFAAVGIKGHSRFRHPTIPFPVLSDVDLNVPLPKRRRRFIREFELDCKEKVIAGFDKRAWRQP